MVGQTEKSNSDRIHSVPFLVIDDEADNASIQSMSKRIWWGEGQKVSNIDFE